MASLMEELLDVLGTEEKEYKKLIELSGQKTKALIAADIKTVQEIAEKEQDYVELIQKCEKKCNEVITDMGIVLGKDTEEITVIELISMLEKQPKEQHKLQIVYDNLITTAKKMKVCNERNKMLVDQALELVEFDLTLYQSMRMAPENANYSKEALNTSAAQEQGRFDAKQ